MNNKALLFGLMGLIIVVGILGIIYPKAIQTIVSPVTEKLGGADEFFPYWSENKVTRYPYRVEWTQATSTVCSILSPTATSSLAAWPRIQQTEATATDVWVSWGRGADGGNEDYATTTLFGAAATTTPNVVFSNNDTAIDDFIHSVNATTSEFLARDSNLTAIGLDQIIFPPNTRFNVRLDAKNLNTEADMTGAESFNLNGSCEAVFNVF